MWPQTNFNFLRVTCIVKCHNLCLLCDVTEVFCEPTNPCLNGATCMENNGIDFMCMCAADYTGMRCETGTGTTLCRVLGCSRAEGIVVM